MAKIAEFQLRTLGWERDPPEERIRLSTFDYLAAAVYNSYALFFELNNSHRPKVVETLKEGLERTLSQCRQLVGRIEKNKDNDDHSFVKRRSDTVRLLVEHWNDSDSVPSFAELEKAQFCTRALGDVRRFVTPGMEYGEKPESMLAAKPVVSGFKINFIPGGLILVLNWHHYANDAAGFGNFTKQLADNCFAVYRMAAPPAWDMANMDASRFTATAFPTSDKIEGPKPPRRHTDAQKHSSVLFHLPKSKAAELKQLATPVDGKWISTYDAFTAFLWRSLTRHRMALYDVSPDDTPLFIEGINLRPRTEPPVASRQQRNLFWAALSNHFPHPLTLDQITSHDDMNQSAIDAALSMLAPVRDKTGLFSRADSFPPLTFAITDWRCADVCRHDFGFGSAKAYRHSSDSVSDHLCILYPPRVASAGNDPEEEGCEFAVAIEPGAVASLLADQTFSKYFEFRGYEVEIE